jgi:hypothetical protein
MDWWPGIPAEANPHVYILWLLRSGRVTDFGSLAREFGFDPRCMHTGHYLIIDYLRSLEDAGLIVTERSAGEKFPTRIGLSENWRKIQLALDVSLTELRMLGREAIITTPYFGKPKKPAKTSDLFVLMPFTQELKPVYEDHIRNCADGLHLSVARGDDFFTAHAVMGDIWNAISSSRGVIADCTGRNPNVFYEIGLAHASGKPVILITQNVEDVPFDIRHLRYIQYDFTPRGMRVFEKRLIDTLKTELLREQYNVQGQEKRIGFMVAEESDEARARMAHEYKAVEGALAAAQTRLIRPWGQTYVPDFKFVLRRDSPGDAEYPIVHIVGVPQGVDALMVGGKRAERVDPSELAATFRRDAGQVECVVLSACFSDEQAVAIADYVPYVIGIHAEIGIASTSFAVDFYKSLNAGRSIVEAHEIGCNRVRLEGVPERLLPELMRRN